MHLQASMVRKAQGVVVLSTYEYEPGAKSAVESTFGGRCLQVGYVYFVPINLLVLNSTLAALHFLSAGGLVPSTNLHQPRTI